MRLPSGYSTYDYSVTARSKGWGEGWPTCSNRNQVATITLARSGTKIPIHSRLSRLALVLLNEIERRGYLCGPYGTWGGQCRPISGTSVPSNHSWWLAFDIRAPWNPYTTTGQHDIPDFAYALFRAYGFGLGADYDGAKDWMHVEWMGTPADLDIMTARAVLAFRATTPPSTEDDDMALTAAEVNSLIFTPANLDKIANRTLQVVANGANRYGLDAIRDRVERFGGATAVWREPEDSGQDSANWVWVAFDGSRYHVNGIPGTDFDGAAELKAVWRVSLETVEELPVEHPLYQLPVWPTA